MRKSNRQRYQNKAYIQNYTFIIQDTIHSKRDIFVSFLQNMHGDFNTALVSKTQ